MIPPRPPSPPSNTANFPDAPIVFIHGFKGSTLWNCSAQQKAFVRWTDLLNLTKSFDISVDHQDSSKSTSEFQPTEPISDIFGSKFWSKFLGARCYGGLLESLEREFGISETFSGSHFDDNSNYSNSSLTSPPLSGSCDHSLPPPPPTSPTKKTHFTPPKPSSRLLYFVYDWRLPNHRTALQFLNFLKTLATPPIILAHSNGGLLAQWAIASAAPQKIARGVVYAGCPFHGSESFLQDLNGGKKLLFNKSLLRREVMRTFAPVFCFLSDSGLKRMEADEGEFVNQARTFKSERMNMDFAEHPPSVIIAGVGTKTDVSLLADGNFKTSDGDRRFSRECVVLKDLLSNGGKVFEVQKTHDKLLDDTELVINLLAELNDAGKADQIGVKKRRASLSLV